MNNDIDVLDIFLRPGEFYFGSKKTRIRTLLGSCVAITMWHPKLFIGGMCHYMLPERPLNKTQQMLDGHYASDAMRMFMNELSKTSTRPSEYQVKLFGGGNMFPNIKNTRGGVRVSEKNIEAGKQLLKSYGFRISREDTSGVGHRNVIFEIWTGDVWIKNNKTTIK